MAARYVPPGARSKEIQGCNSENQAEDRQRSLAELVAKDEKTDIPVFTVKLRSDNSYGKDCKDYKWKAPLRLIICVSVSV